MIQLDVEGSEAIGIAMGLLKETFPLDSTALQRIIDMLDKVRRERLADEIDRLKKRRE